MYNAGNPSLVPKDHLYVRCITVYSSYTYLYQLYKERFHTTPSPLFPFPRNVIQADQIRQAPEQGSLSLQLHRIILRDRANAKARLAGKVGKTLPQIWGSQTYEGEMTTWNHTWLEKSCEFDAFGCCFPNWGYKLLDMILCVYIYITVCILLYIYIWSAPPPRPTNPIC